MKSIQKLLFIYIFERVLFIHKTFKLHELYFTHLCIIVLYLVL